MPSFLLSELYQTQLAINAQGETIGTQKHSIACIENRIIDIFQERAKFYVFEMGNINTVFYLNNYKKEYIYLDIFI